MSQSERSASESAQWLPLVAVNATGDALTATKPISRHFNIDIIVDANGDSLPPSTVPENTDLPPVAQLKKLGGVYIFFTSPSVSLHYDIMLNDFVSNVLLHAIKFPSSLTSPGKFRPPGSGIKSALVTSTTSSSSTSHSKKRKESEPTTDKKEKKAKKAKTN